MIYGGNNFATRNFFLLRRKPRQLPGIRIDITEFSYPYLS
jgi:hypothetical protein